MSFDTKAKTYTYREGMYTSEAAPFEVTTSAIRFASGPLQGKDVALPTGVIASCRILMVGGVALSREASVTDCPFPAPKRTAAECALVGQHITESKSGSSSSGSSDSTSIVLEKDGFYRKVVGHSSWACYSTRCSVLYSAGPAEVGTWSLSGGQIAGPNISAQALADYDFTAADGACP